MSSSKNRPNKHPTLGVCYYPEQWPEDMWGEDASRMGDIGLDYVRIGEFAWSRMEPKAGQYDWGWLDRSIETLGKAGRKVILCTPTPTPPKWLTDANPEVLRHNEQCQPMKHGARRHISVASKTYRAFSQQITQAMVDRYGKSDFVAGWQTDNEYGCHDSTLSYGPEDRDAFSKWLQARYTEIATLNEAWGNSFWSQTYDTFEQIDVPTLTQAEVNPAHWMDFRRFFSDMTVEFNRKQVEIIRTGSPDRFVTHNCMCNEGGFDHWKLAQDLDFLSWDSYPLGFLDTVMERFGSDVSEDINSLMRSNFRLGHPDIVAYHHDLYRSASGGRFWVMEQQPGPVNWANHNPSPVDGAVKFWSLEAMAHGAETVSYFRWRQAPWSQEQMHTGMNTPWNTEDQAAIEARALAPELANLPLHELNVEGDNTVALYFDFEADWFFEALRQGASCNIFEWTFTWYTALRQLGFNIEIFGPETWTVEKLQDVKLFVFPTMPINRRELLNALPKNAQKVFGPRSGSRTENIAFEAVDPLGKTTSKPTPPPYLEAGNQRLFTGMVAHRVESLRPDITLPVSSPTGLEVHAKTWVEHLLVTADQTVRATFSGSMGGTVAGANPAWVQQDSNHYLAFISDIEGTQDIASTLANEAGLSPIEDMPTSLRIRRFGPQENRKTALINYGLEAVTHNGTRVDAQTVEIV